MVVHLPDLDQAVADRISLAVQDPAREVRDLADRGRVTSMLTTIRSLSVSRGSLLG